MADFYDDVNWVDVNAVGGTGQTGLNQLTAMIIRLRETYPGKNFALVPRASDNEPINQRFEFERRNWKMLRVKHVGEKSIKSFNENSPLRMNITPEQGNFGAGAEAPLRWRNNWIMYIDADLERTQRAMDEVAREADLKNAASRFGGRAMSKNIPQDQASAVMTGFTETQVPANQAMAELKR
jgi:hypothetical protein